MAKKIILVLLSALLVIYLLRQVDVREVFRVVYDFPPRYLFAGFACFVAGHFARTLRFKILLREDVPFKSLFSITAVQTAASVFMPLRSGEFSLMYLLKREHNVDYAVGAAVIVLAKVLEVRDDAIVVQKGKEKWEIARTPDTKVTGELKAGEKVTIEYRMTAASVEAKAAKATKAGAKKK